MSAIMETDSEEMIVKRVSVPLGLEELMEGLTKEVLLKKPNDIYLFAAEYFSKLLSLREKGNYKVKSVASAQSVTRQSSKQPIEKLLIRGASKQLSRQISIRSESPVKKNIAPRKLFGRKDQKEDKYTDRSKFVERRSKNKQIEPENKNSQLKPTASVRATSQHIQEKANAEHKRDRSVSTSRRGRSASKSVQSTPRQKSISTPRSSKNDPELNKSGKNLSRDDEYRRNKTDEVIGDKSVAPDTSNIQKSINSIEVAETNKSISKENSRKDQEKIDEHKQIGNEDEVSDKYALSKMFNPDENLDGVENKQKSENTLGTESKIVKSEENKDNKVEPESKDIHVAFKIPSIEDNNEFIKDGKLTVTPPKATKRPQTPKSHELIQSLVVPTVTNSISSIPNKNKPTLSGENAKDTNVDPNFIENGTNIDTKVTKGESPIKTDYNKVDTNIDGIQQKHVDTSILKSEKSIVSENILISKESNGENTTEKNKVSETQHFNISSDNIVLDHVDIKQAGDKGTFSNPEMASSLTKIEDEQNKNNDKTLTEEEIFSKNKDSTVTDIDHIHDLEDKSENEKKYQELSNENIKEGHRATNGNIEDSLELNKDLEATLEEVSYDGNEEQNEKVRDNIKEGQIISNTLLLEQHDKDKDDKLEDAKIHKEVPVSQPISSKRGKGEIKEGEKINSLRLIKEDKVDENLTEDVKNHKEIVNGSAKAKNEKNEGDTRGDIVTKFIELDEPQVRVEANYSSANDGKEKTLSRESGNTMLTSVEYKLHQKSESENMSNPNQNDYSLEQITYLTDEENNHKDKDMEPAKGDIEKNIEEIGLRKEIEVVSDTPNLIVDIEDTTIFSTKDDSEMKASNVVNERIEEITTSQKPVIPTEERDKTNNLVYVNKENDEVNNLTHIHNENVKSKEQGTHVEENLGNNTFPCENIKNEYTETYKHDNLEKIEENNNHSDTMITVHIKTKESEEEEMASEHILRKIPQHEKTLQNELVSSNNDKSPRQFIEEQERKTFEMFENSPEPLSTNNRDIKETLDANDQFIGQKNTDNKYKSEKNIEGMLESELVESNSSQADSGKKIDIQQIVGNTENEVTGSKHTETSVIDEISLKQENDTHNLNVVDGEKNEAIIIGIVEEKENIVEGERKNEEQLSDTNNLNQAKNSNREMIQSMQVENDKEDYKKGSGSDVVIIHTIIDKRHTNDKEELTTDTQQEKIDEIHITSSSHNESPVGIDNEKVNSENNQKQIKKIEDADVHTHITEHVDKLETDDNNVNFVESNIKIDQGYIPDKIDTERNEYNTEIHGESVNTQVKNRKASIPLSDLAQSDKMLSEHISENANMIQNIQQDDGNEMASKYEQNANTNEMAKHGEKNQNDLTETETKKDNINTDGKSNAHELHTALRTHELEETETLQETQRGNLTNVINLVLSVSKVHSIDNVVKNYLNDFIQKEKQNVFTKKDGQADKNFSFPQEENNHEQDRKIDISEQKYPNGEYIKNTVTDDNKEKYIKSNSVTENADVNKNLSEIPDKTKVKAKDVVSITNIENLVPIEQNNKSITESLHEGNILVNDEVRQSDLSNEDEFKLNSTKVQNTEHVNTNHDGIMKYVTTDGLDEAVKEHINTFLFSEKKNVFVQSREHETTQNLQEISQRETNPIENNDSIEIRRQAFAEGHSEGMLDKLMMNKSITKMNDILKEKVEAKKTKSKLLSQNGIKSPENISQNIKKNVRKIRRVKTIDVINDDHKVKPEVKSRIPTADYKHRIKREKDNGKHSVLIKQTSISHAEKKLESEDLLDQKKCNLTTEDERNDKILDINSDSKDISKEVSQLNAEESDEANKGDLRINNTEKSKFDISKLREEIKAAEEETKATFESSFNANTLKQETKNVSLNQNVSSKNEVLNKSTNILSEVVAAIRIQSIWRGYVIRKNKSINVGEMEKQVCAENKVDAIEVSHFNTRNDNKLEVDDKQTKITLKLDETFVSKKSSKSVCENFDLKEESNEESIKNTEHKKSNCNEEDNEKFANAALKIQALWRGFQVRKFIRRKTQQHKLDQSSEHNEKGKSDHLLKDFVCRSNASELEVNDNFIKAAIMIQKIWRGFRVRRKVNKNQKLGKHQEKNQQVTVTNTVEICESESNTGKMKIDAERDMCKIDTQNTENQFSMNEIKLRKAAITIQRIWRGFKVRNRLNKRDKKSPEMKGVPSQEDNEKCEGIKEKSDVNIKGPKEEEERTVVVNETIDFENTKPLGTHNRETVSTEETNNEVNDFKKSATKKTIKQLESAFLDSPNTKQSDADIKGSQLLRMNEEETKTDFKDFIKDEATNTKTQANSQSSNSTVTDLNKKEIVNIEGDKGSYPDYRKQDANFNEKELESTVLESSDTINKENEDKELISDSGPEHLLASSLDNEKTYIKNAMESESLLAKFEDNNRFIKAATIIQKIWRGFKVRQHLNKNRPFGTKVEREHSVVETLEPMEKTIQKDRKSALKIQSLWRGYQVRKNIGVIKNKLEDKNAANTEIEREITDGDILNAATKIQAGIRGYLQRKRNKRDINKLNSITEEDETCNSKGLILNEDIDLQPDATVRDSSITNHAKQQENKEKENEGKLSDTEVFKAIQELHKLEIPNEISVKKEQNKPSFYRTNTVHEPEIIKQHCSLLKSISLDNNNNNSQQLGERSNNNINLKHFDMTDVDPDKVITEDENIEDMPLNDKTNLKKIESSYLEKHEQNIILLKTHNESAYPDENKNLEDLVNDTSQEKLLKLTEIVSQISDEKNLNSKENSEVTKNDIESKDTDKGNKKDDINKTESIGINDINKDQKNTIDEGEELFHDPSTSIDSLDSVVTIIGDSENKQKGNESNDHERESENDTSAHIDTSVASDITKEAFLQHENLINDFQNKLLDKISGKNGESTSLTEDVNTTFDMEQLRKELKEAGLIYNNEDNRDIKHQNSTEDVSGRDKLLDYVNNFYLENGYDQSSHMEDTSNNRTARHLADITEEQLDTKSPEEKIHKELEATPENTVDGNSVQESNTVNKNILQSELNIQKIQSTLKECENIAHEINMGFKNIEDENSSTINSNTDDNDADDNRNEHIFCKVPGSTQMCLKYIDNKPLSEYVELINAPENTRLENNLMKQGVNSNNMIDIVSKIENMPEDLSSKNNDVDKSSSSVNKLLHTGELHDTVVIPLLPPKETKSQESNTPDGMSAQLSSKNNTQFSECSNSKLLHTGELHDTVVITLPLATQNNCLNDIQCQENTTDKIFSNEETTFVDPQEFHPENKTCETEAMKTISDRKSKLLHTGELHDTVVITLPLSKSVDHRGENISDTIPERTLINTEKLKSIENLNSLSENTPSKSDTSKTNLNANMGLLHTGELHDTVMVSRPIDEIYGLKDLRSSDVLPKENPTGLEQQDLSNVNASHVGELQNNMLDPISQTIETVDKIEVSEKGSEMKDDKPQHVDSESQTTGEAIAVQLNQASDNSVQYVQRTVRKMSLDGLNAYNRVMQEKIMLIIF